MAAAYPQPLQARPYEEPSPRARVPVEDDDGDDYEDGDGMDDVEEGNVNSMSIMNSNINSSCSNSSVVNVAEHGVVVAASRTSELTLSFEGEVYVFPAVTPEKVNFYFNFSSRCPTNR